MSATDRPGGRAGRQANPARTGEAVARAARERSEQERETPRLSATRSHLPAAHVRGPEPSQGASHPPGSSAGRWRTAWIALPLAVAVALLVVVLATRDSAFERNASSPILGGLAPPVAGVTTAGEPFDLDQWRGRWVIVNFFQSTCIPCIREHPELIAFSQRHAAAGDARVVSVTFDDTAENVRRFFEVNGGDWPVLVEGAGEAAVAYGVTGVPESYLVAPSGVVVWKQLGGVTADGIDDVIAQLTGPS